MSIGPHAVGSRWSPLDASSSELSAFPLLTLPGGMTRLVRFRPGTAPGPEQSQQLIPVRGDSLLGLTSADRRCRLDDWDEVSAAIDAVLPAAVDDSWQLVQSRSAWTDPTGAAAGDLAVHLRRGDDHLLVVEEEDGPMLHPVTSLRAWEQMIQVLPDQGDIARPHPGDAPADDRS